MSDYRLVYGEVEPGLVDRESAYTRLAEVSAEGSGFHCPLRLERHANDDDWDVVDYDAVDGVDVKDTQPWDDAEKRILERNNITDVYVPRVTPW